jgi:hypothetical protein
MRTNPHQSMLYPQDIGLTLDALLAEIIGKRLSNEMISNLKTFINSFLSRLAVIFQNPPTLSE